MTTRINYILCAGMTLALCASMTSLTATAQMLLPYSGSVTSDNPAFVIENFGLGRAGSFGVRNSSSSSPGVLGYSDGSGPGVYGDSNLGPGVRGRSLNGDIGVWGQSLHHGVVGQGYDSGVLGESINGSAIWGVSQYGLAGRFDGVVQINGLSKMTGFQLTTSPIEGYVLTSDPTGKGTWQPITIPNGSITNAKLANGSVSNSKLASDSSSLSKVSGGVMMASGGKIGIGRVPFYKLDVNGTVWCTSLIQGSDARYKTHIATLDNALDKILNLRGVSYDWNRDAFKEHDFPQGRQIGFIAQEIEGVLPELVTTDARGFKSVAYQNVIPVLVEAVKGQQKQIMAMKVENEKVRADVTDLQAQVAQMATRQGTGQYGFLTLPLLTGAVLFSGGLIMRRR